jgi:CRP-like cAMP-binding protein
MLPPAWLQNQLLAGLPEESFERLRPHLEPLSLKQGETLFESETASTDVYFPVTSVVSLSSFRRDGVLIRVSHIGPEGVIGIPFFLIGKVIPCRGVVHKDGLAYRLPASCLTQEFNRGGPPLRLFLRYAKSLMAQMEQTAICHTVESLDQKDCASCGHAKRCTLTAANEPLNDVLKPGRLERSVPAEGRRDEDGLDQL